MKSILSIIKQSGGQALARQAALALLALFSITAQATTPTFSIVFSPDTISPGGVSTLTYTIDNSGAGTVPITDMDFTDTLPTGVTIAPAPRVSTSCVNGTYTATANSNTINFNDYRIGTGSSCTFSVDVTSTVIATHSHTSGDLITSAGTVSGASDDLIVATAALTISMAYSPSTIAPGEISTLTYTLDATNSALNLFGIQFWHYHTGVEVSASPNVSSTCSGINFSPNGGDTSYQIRDVSMTLGTTCTIQVDVTSSTANSYTTSTTSGLYYETGNFSPFTLSPATATLNVQLPLMYMNFPASNVPGTSVALTYNISNFERTDITDLNFTNDLNATLSGLAATSLPANNFCGSGSTMTGTSTLSINGVNLAAGASCSFSVTVLIPANAAAGNYTNTTSTINLTRDSATTSPAVSNNLSVKLAPSISAVFDSSVIAGGNNLTQTFTLTNTDAANSATNIGFTQDISSIIDGTTISTLPATNTCGTGSTFTTTSTNASSVILVVSGANLAAGDSCNFSVTYAIPAEAATGNYTFTTSTLSATVNGTNVYTPPITTSVNVTTAPTLAFALDSDSYTPGSTATATFTIEFSEDAAADATSIGFTVDLNSVLTGMALSGGDQSNICGTGSSLTGTGIITFAGGTLSPGSTCTITAPISIPAAGSLSGTDYGTVTLTSSTLTAQSSGLSLTRAAVNTSYILSGLSFTMSANPTTTLDNNSIVFTYTFTNAAGSPDASSIAFTQNYSSTINSMQATSLPGTFCNGASVTGTTFLIFSGGSLTGGSTCTFNVTVAIPDNVADGSYKAITSGVSASVSGQNIALASKSLDITIESLSVVLSTTAGASTNTSPIPVTINFSRAVNNFISSDLNVSNGTVASFSGSGSDYTATITPTTDGTVTVDVPVGVANDAVFGSETNPAATTLSIAYSSTPATPTPTIAISAPSATNTNTGPITYTVTYTNASEVNLTSSAISLNATGTSASVAVTNGDTNTPTVTLSSITGDGTLGFSIAANTARNGEESAAAYGPSTTFNVDNTAPTVTISDSVNDIINTTFTATFTFSEDVNGFTESDISATNASVSNFATVTGTVYTALITPTSDGDVLLDVAANVATDGVGNNNTAASQHKVVYDTVGPNIVISGPTSDIKTPQTITFTFAEDVTGFAVEDITVTNGSLSGFTATSPSVYTATLNPASEGLVTINVAASVAIDTATNGNVAATQYSVTYDTTAPTVVVSSTDTAFSGKFTALFTFNENVTGFDINDITVTNASIDNFITNNAKEYKADITPTNEGQVDVSVAASLATDTAGNNNVGSNILSVNYDITAPTLNITTSKTDVNTFFTATFTFSESVSGFDISDINASNASVTNFASNSASEYTATITPASEGSVTVDVAASQATDPAGNNNIAGNQLVVNYDTTAPTVVVTTTATEFNQDFTATFTFDEDINGFDVSEITVANGSASNLVSKSKSIYEATISPASEGQVDVSLAASLVDDNAGNANIGSNVLSVNYDITGATVIISADKSLSNTDFTITFTFDEDVTDFTSNDLSTDNGSFSNFSATSKNVYTAKLQPSTDGNVALNVAAGAAFDGAGNGNSAAQTLNLAYDITGPKLIISGPASTVSSTFDTTFTFDEAVTGFASDDITVSNGTVSNFVTKSTSEFTVSITPTKDGDVTVNVAASLLTDVAGNANSASNIYTVGYDTVKPGVVISGPTTPVNGAFDIEIDFDETVSGFAQSMITVTNGSVTAFNTQSQTKYKATITPSSDGNVTAQIAADVVTDSPGNTNTASNLYTVTYDSAAPTIASLSPANNEQNASASNELKITFNETIAAGDSSNFIYLKDAGDNSTVEAIAASSSGISINDKVVTITLTNKTVETHEYYVQIDSQAFKDTAGNAFAGISDNNTWRFKVSNLPPDVVADIATVDEDASVLIDVLANDTDSNSTINPASLRIATAATKGSTNINPATGIITYTPHEDLSGNDEFTYQVSDLLGKQSAEAKVTINIKSINDAPIANNDLINTDANVNITIDVLANDTDVDGNSEIDANSIAITKAPQNGSAELIDGKIYYKPNASYFGSDNFEYSVQDIHQAVSNNGKVFINVVGTNIPPVAGNDSFSTDEDTKITLTPLTNDSDSDGQIDATTTALVSEPSLGNITVNSDGSMTYEPHPDVNGTDTFDYSVKDNEGLWAAPATISVTINSINDAPRVENDTLVLLNTTVAQTINVLSNDVDVDGTISAIAIGTQPQFGSVSIDSTTNIITYTPSASFGTQDSFTYTATDNQNLTSAVATVTVSDTPINIPPVANNDQVQTNEDQFIAINVLANDSDLNGRIVPSTLTITVAPTNGSASVRSGSGEIYYTPNSNFSGEDKLTYKIEDNRGDSDTAIVTIKVNSVNDIPTATSLNLSTNEDIAVAVTLAGSDIDGDVITYDVETTPANGTLSGTMPNLTYTPNANFAGVDSFFYVVNDGKVDSNLTTVTITVAGINDAPTANNQVVSLNEDTSQAIFLVGGDIDGDTLSYRVTSQPTNGALTGSNNALVYAPNLDFNGSDSFTFVTNDGTVDSAPATVSINVIPVNDAPVANGQNLTLNEDSSIAVLLNATDEDNDPLTYIINQSPTHGVLEGTAPQLTYRPNANFNGNDSFSFSANDGSASSTVVQVNLTVNAINDAPIAQNLNLTTSEDLPLSISFAGTDPDNDPLSLVNRTEPSNGVITGNGLTIIYTPNENFNGTDSFTYQLSDGNDTSATASVNITISAINDVPVAVTDQIEQTGTAPITIDVVANDTDADGDALTLTTVTPSVGNATIVNNQLLYTPDSNFIGQTTVFYIIQDSAGASAQGQAQIRIRRENNGQAIVQVPADIHINATGVLTTVDLGVAQAFDQDGTPLAVTLLNDSNHFKPGVNTVYWQATDSQGNISIGNQTVTIEPQVAIDSYQIVQEGNTAKVNVSLNGPAVNYPMVIPYTISGNAQTDEDHNIQSGELIINSGTHAQFDIALIQDNITEGDETLIITLDSSLNLGAQSQHQLTISEQAQAPKLDLNVVQNDIEAMVVNREEGLISINLSADQPLDDFNINWSLASDQAPTIENLSIENLSDDIMQFVFDPQLLATGSYSFNVSSQSKSIDSLSTDASITVLVQQSSVQLSSEDSDQDGISDIIEGLTDSDNDGIANYLDAINNCNVLASNVDNVNKHLVVSQAGSCLRLGTQAFNTQAHNATTNGITDVVVSDLVQAGASYKLVIAQQQPLPKDAVVQMYLEALSTDDKWVDFSENANNYIMSAQGQNGVCPAPASNQWQAGSQAGHWCIQLTLEDGGINDGDSAINRAISVTTKVISLADNSLPVLADDTTNTRQGFSTTIDVLANDSDPDGDSLSLTHVSALFGEVSIVDNQIHYQPKANHLGTDTIEYLASDNQSGAQSATLIVTISANSVPIAMDDYADVTAGQSIIVDVLSNDNDPDGDTLTLLGVTSSNGSVSIVNNAIRYQAGETYSGDDVINYQVSDGYGGQTVGTLIVSVTVIASDNNQPDQPIAEPTSGGGGSTQPLWLMMLGLLFMVRSRRRR